MGKYFDDLHAGWDSQLTGAPCDIADTEEILSLRETAEDYDNLMSLGDALTRQLRYREAAERYTNALENRPGDYTATRNRAGRYLSTLQTEAAKKDLHFCLENNGDEMDITYRLGLCFYFDREYADAAHWFGRCYPLCDEEMGIAIIYWHTICSYRMKVHPELLDKYHTGMNVGHHTAYEKAVRVFAGAMSTTNALAELEHEPEDLEYAITMYGLCRHLLYSGQAEIYKRYMKRLIERDGFWPCYAYLAAWNDTMEEKE